MTERHHLGPSLNPDISYWAFQPDDTVNENNKVKLHDVHPIKSLVVTANGCGSITVWNYAIRKPLFICLVSEIVRSFQILEKSNSAVRSSNYFISERLSKRSNGGHTPSFQNRSDCGIRHLSLMPKAKGTMNVKQVTFAESAIASGLQSSSHFCSTLLLVVCDHVVLLVDYVTRVSIVIGEAELGDRSGVFPTSADMISSRCVAIGCSDGAIRFWDITQKKCVYILAGYCKGAVGMMRTIPVEKSDGYLQSSESSVRIRLLSFGADGVVLIWSLSVTLIPPADIGLTIAPSIVVSTEFVTEGCPVARLKESLSVVASGGLCRHQVTYDAHTSSLMVCVGDRKIKAWDMSEASEAQIRNRASLGSQHQQNLKSTANLSSSKRMSVLKNVMGGGSSGSIGMSGVGAELHCIPCTSTVKPGDKRERRVEVASFASLHGPLYAPDTFVLCSKNNTIGIYKSRESFATDDKSERSSVVTTGGNERSSQRLQLIQEFSVTTLMERYLHKSGGDLVGHKEILTQSAPVKVYSVSAHPSQSHLIILATSVGMMVLSVPPLSCGALTGHHPSWGSQVLVFANNVMRKVLLPNLADIQMDENGGSATEGGELHGEVLSELALGESSIEAAQKQLGNNGKRTALLSGGRKMSGIALPAPSLTTSLETATSRPAFMPSPSGRYAAMVWWESLLYVIVRINTSEGDALTIIDRGYCLSLAWVGRDDCYLVRSALRVVSSLAEKKKRSSVLGGMLFSADKEVRRLLPSEMLLMQCGTEESRARTLSMSADCSRAFTTATGESTLVDLFSGSLICFNMANRKGSLATRVNTTATGPGDDTAVADGSIHGDMGLIISDLERTEREVRGSIRASKSALCGQFYCLVSSREAARRLALAAAVTERMAKDRGNKAKNPTQSSGTKHAPALESGEGTTGGGDDDQWTLLAVNPVMQAVDAVAWDYDTGRCAVLFGLSRITVLQLCEDEIVAGSNVGAPVLQSLFCIDLSNISGSVHSSVTSLVWSSDLLCITTSFGVVAYRVHHKEETHFAFAEEVQCGGTQQQHRQDWIWGEAAGVVQQSSVYVANGRDSTFRRLKLIQSSQTFSSIV